jgi:hypothetical protein
MFVALIVLQLLSIALSRNPALSLDKFIVAQLYWTLPFFIGCYVFRKPGRAERWAAWLCLILLPLAICAYWEWSRGQVPWAGRVPPVSGGWGRGRATRSGRRLSRCFPAFIASREPPRRPLGFAEYLALTTPFLIHFAIGPYRPFVRIAAALGLPLAFHLIILTDSRLGCRRLPLVLPPLSRRMGHPALAAEPGKPVRAGDHAGLPAHLRRFHRGDLHRRAAAAHGLGRR